MGEKQKEWRKKNSYKTKFSVIIPMKDTSEYIEKALESIRKQEYKECEVLVVDDHSNDNSKEKVEDFINNNPVF